MNGVAKSYPCNTHKLTILRIVWHNRHNDNYPLVWTIVPSISSFTVVPETTQV